MKRIDSGFTLLELMIVVGIVATLFAIAIPVFGDYRAQARDGMAQADARNAISLLTAAQQ